MVTQNMLRKYKRNQLIKTEMNFKCWVVHKLPQIYTANHATFPIQIRKITVQICGNFWVTQYLLHVERKSPEMFVLSSI